MFGIVNTAETVLASLASRQVNERITHLDGLRGVAVAMVVLMHAYVVSGYYVPTPPGTLFRLVSSLLWRGYLGVPLFFVLSTQRFLPLLPCPQATAQRRS